MRLRVGRPDLEQYAARFDVPPAAGDFAVTFLGVSSLLLDDGHTRLLTDGFLSRPSLLDVGLRKLAPDRERIEAALARTGVHRLDAVMPVHTHFDHAMDSAFVADRTGALLVGSESAPTSHAGTGCPLTVSGW
jgi:L-ascorbate metabolism protein UlaG (beta-lactamase superfamily)